ncbi:hypothetical protein Tco_0100729, partial [Tanacetum coccineum]
MASFYWFLASILILETSLDPPWSDVELHLSETLLDPPWSDVELHLSGNEFLRGNKEVFVYLVDKCGDGGACKVVGWLLDDMVV